MTVFGFNVQSEFTIFLSCSITTKENLYKSEKENKTWEDNKLCAQKTCILFA